MFQKLIITTKLTKVKNWSKYVMIESINYIKYKILDTGRAFIITREPVLVENLSFEFIDAPKGCTVIFESDNKHLLRELDENNSCSVPTDKFNGVVKVTVTLLNGRAKSQKWICEELYAKSVKESTLISPNVMNLPKSISELAIENERIRRDNETIHKELTDAKDRITLLEGKVIQLGTIFDTNSLNFLIK